MLRLFSFIVLPRPSSLSPWWLIFWLFCARIKKSPTVGRLDKSLSLRNYP